MTTTHDVDVVENAVLGASGLLQEAYTEIVVTDFLKRSENNLDWWNTSLTVRASADADEMEIQKWLDQSSLIAYAKEFDAHTLIDAKGKPTADVKKAVGYEIDWDIVLLRSNKSGNLSKRSN